MGFVIGFLSYLILMLVFVVVGGVAIFLGISLRKKSNAKAERLAVEAEETEAEA